jgi:hypothetical protein
MARTKQTSKKSRRSKALPVLGAAGASLAMTGAASASAVPAAELPFQGSAYPPVVMLGEEEISDISLGTFYVLDQEDAEYLGVQLAQRCRGGGCRGCGGVGRCGGRCAAVARCGGVGRCAVARCRCRCGARCGCGCGVGVTGCAGCGCTCTGCTGPCWRIGAGAWIYVC